MKLIKVDDLGYHEELTGTCELCFHVVDIHKKVFVFERKDETTFEVKDWRYHYSDIEECPEIDNILLFAEWLAEQEFDEYHFGFEELNNAIFDYIKSRKEQRHEITS